MSINDKLQKIKQFLDGDKGRAFYVALLMVLVASSSFGLGRLSKMAQNSKPVVIEYEAQSLVANASQGAYKASEKGIGLPAQAENSPTGLFVASKKGKKYYPINCSAGSSLKEDNKIFFQTEAEAEAAGYTQSSSCSY